MNAGVPDSRARQDQNLSGNSRAPSISAGSRRRAPEPPKAFQGGFVFFFPYGVLDLLLFTSSQRFAGRDREEETPLPAAAHALHEVEEDQPDPRTRTTRGEALPANPAAERMGTDAIGFSSRRIINNWQISCRIAELMEWTGFGCSSSRCDACALNNRGGAAIIKC